MGHRIGVGSRWLRSAALLVACAAATAVAVEVRKIRPPAPDDETLRQAVLMRISGRVGVDVSRVTVSASAGTVALSGAMPTLHERSELERYASQVYGVTSIDNRVEVDRQERGDPILELEADRSLRASPRLASFGLQVSVRDAAATLQGEVPLATDREEAEEAISRVAGIVAIDNRIRLAPVPADPATVRRRVESLLHAKLLFGGAEELKVVADEGGSVTLTGVVATLADRLRAERLAFGVRGVTSVRNELVVRRFKGPGP